MSRRPDTGLCGVLLLNKPQDFTSFDAVAKMRGISGTRKIGHSGTLDPMATGVLPLLFGTAAKACDILPVTDKRYTAGVKFGLETDTQDIWGTVTAQSGKVPSRAALEEVLSRFTGEILQVPPMYSAVQINGRRLYDLARQGIEVERQARPVTIHALTLLDYSEQTGQGTLDVCCSKGTYIRTLCHDIGEALGTGAVMSSLVRTEAAGFPLSACVTMEQAEQAARDGVFPSLLLPVEKLFETLPVITLGEAQARMFQNGVRLDLNRVRCAKIGGNHAVYGPGNAFLGLAACDFDRMELVMQKLFAQRS